MSLVLDLRSADEVDARPHPFAAHAAYRRRPLIDPDAERRRDPAAERSVGEVYCASLHRNAATLAAVFSTLASAGPGPVLFGCAAGKDRTGMVAAILLDLADVTRSEIVADYCRAEPGVARASDIGAMLDHLQQHDGSSSAYLRGLGLSSGEVARVRSLLRP